MSKTTADDSKKKAKKREKKAEKKKLDKATRKQLRAERRQARVALLEKVPKVDEHGISYTKQQLRRMAKRLAKGLPALETKQEAHQRLVNESRLKRELEDDLAGDEEVPMEGGAEEDSDDEVPMEGENVSDSDDEEEEQDESNRNEEASKEESSSFPASTALSSPTVQTFRIKCHKPVPSDYVCSACHNKILPAHWIYDCPQKHTKGIHDPSANKVFVSGLPFEANHKYVTDLFGALRVKHLKLLTFNDSQRCKGQAFVTLSNEVDAKQALKMNGTVLDTTSNGKGSDQKKPMKKPLVLKVTRVLNRHVTKHQKQRPPQKQQQ